MMVGMEQSKREWIEIGGKQCLFVDGVCVAESPLPVVIRIVGTSFNRLTGLTMLEVYVPETTIEHLPDGFMMTQFRLVP